MTVAAGKWNKTDAPLRRGKKILRKPERIPGFYPVLIVNDTIV